MAIPPNNAVIGILSITFVLDYSANRVNGELFNFRENPDRTEGDAMLEQSVNWEDQSDVRRLTLSQRNSDGEIKFKAGIAILKKDHLHHILGLPFFQGCFDCERRVLEDNPFHGNLLLKKDTPKSIRTMLRSTLATHVEEVVPHVES